MVTIHLLVIIGFVVFFLSGYLIASAISTQKQSELKNIIIKFQKQNDELIVENHNLDRNLSNQLQDYNKLSGYFRKLRDAYLTLQDGVKKLQIKSVKSESTTRQLATSIMQNQKNSQEIKELKSENASLKLRLQTLTNQLKMGDGDKTHDYYYRYIDQLNYSEQLLLKNKALEKELLVLKNRGIVAGVIGAKQNTQLPSVVNNLNISTYLNAMVKSISSHQKHRGAVFSDEMGFVVASSSEYSDELAGLSALYTHCERIINRNIAFKNLSRVVFVDESELCLTLFPITLNNCTVYFSGLSIGQLDYEAIISKMANHLKVN
jgi:hypothetical protein